ncbi:interferon-inducible double-stranded RNA-dependent protein kinase activator A homolog isoform X1 [Toxorhynchites rutilus septentrionalis]|uniref:interferon-inducible double-stranded RNA-dependent protein kinase activator A homolog isoform X1 n=1 Tax=Toxorhynchites rutilus septentrionalis TaxID=329112 RepID=UPI002479BAF2|nr:interferon-inducible double-stranded RNA-dependent protein kinase activator A homolog isoform X1 [Toxorhynchites rutilus septentrionalis]
MSQSDLPEPENLSSLIENNPPLGNAQAKRPARGWKKGATTTKQDALPIEEALKMELTSANNMKTPISVLQELLSRRGLTPQYDLMQVEGAVHEPTFRYRVSYQDKDAMGTGKSKKEAKHAAAQALIDKLSGNSFNEQQHNGTIPIKAENLSGAEEELAGNPIGWLQEMCMARRWPPPTYETETEIGLPHERQFTIACSVLKYREVGKGKSKKIAKRQAAQLMWKKLQDQPLEPTQLFDEEGNELKTANITERFAGLKDARIPNLTTGHGQKVSQFHMNLKARTGDTLRKLQSTCLNSTSVDFVQMLNDIASEQRFEVTYVDIDELTMSGRHQCLVQLSTLPVAVCHGSGPSAKDAHAAAARNSLEYLKIMTKT